VIAIQHGHPIFALSASYHLEEPGFDHQAKMPDVPHPDALPSEAKMKESFISIVPEAVRRYYETERPIELRPVEFERYTSMKPREPKFNVWIRATGALPDDPTIHNSVLAYASDMTLLDTSLIAHGRTVFDPGIMPASIDHAMWFHRPFRADQWLLYTQDSPNASGACGFTRGLIFSEDGSLVASVVQEGLIRVRAQPDGAKP
jgi:acyl-CoA thioesterase-2